MERNLKEFIELLLNNLKSLDSKVDKLQGDLTTVRMDVAVLKQTQDEVKSLSTCIEHLESRINKSDKELALKNTKWHVISSVITLLIAILIASIAGVFKVPERDNYPNPNNSENSINIRGAGPIKSDTTIKLK